MKKIGIIGGVGPESSIEYYRLIIKQFQARLNTNNYPELIQGLILGGTELPLILNQSDINDIEIFDTTKIHVESIVTRMIEE